MSDDPNNTRWSNSSKSFGKAMLQKSGWTEGEGLGKSLDGVKTHVKVSRKDDVMGIGYQAGVGEVWSAQSVGFADVLDRIKSKTSKAASSDGDSESSPPSSPISSPTGSRYTNMYAKRNKLKTEGLQVGSEAAKSEILGLAGVKRGRSNDANLEVDTASSLVSPSLQRLMVRCPTVEPKASAEEDCTVDRVVVKKPTPRPPKCTETPFLAHC